MLIFMFFLSNGHSPQICENGELLMRMCRGESHFSQKRPFGKCRRVWRVRENRLTNVDEFSGSEQNRLANVDEFSESDLFSKKTILASSRIRQKWQISGEYSNSTNSLSSGHCLVFLFFSCLMFFVFLFC